MREGTDSMVGFVSSYEEKERTELSLSPSLSCEDAVRRQPSANLGQGSHQELDHPAP